MRPALSPRTIVLATIAAGLAFHVVVAATLGLGIDESYTLANTRAFQWSFFDHPPLGFWLARLAAWVAGSEAPLVVRLPYVLLFAGSTWLMFRLGAALLGEAAGAWAAVALNIAPVFAFATGDWVLPDGPLVFFLLAAMLALRPLLVPAPAPLTEREVWRRWLAGGALLGLALLSKYHAFLFAAGLALYVLTVPAARRRLAHPAPWVAGLVALAFLTPVFWWNAEHGWASFLFQGGRGRPSGGLHPELVLAALAGQAAYLLPWTWAGLVRELWTALRRGPAVPARWLLATTAVLPVAIFTIVPLWGSRGLPHWPMPGYLFLFPLLGERLALMRPRTRRRWAGLSLATVAVAAAVLVSQTETGWLNRLAPGAFARGDPTLEAVEWKALRTALAERGWLDRPDLFVVSLAWLEAGKIDYALHGRLPVLVFTDDPRNFAFGHDPAAFVGKDAVIVGTARSARGAAERLAPYFRSIEPLASVPVARGGRPAFDLVLLYGHMLVRPYPLPYGQPIGRGSGGG